jgi:hypothetical protein
LARWFFVVRICHLYCSKLFVISWRENAFTDVLSIII